MASYRDELKALAESIGSDGCTNSPDTNIACCWEHDWTFVTGMTPRGVVVSRAYANQRYRDCIQAESSLRWLSPDSWVRWLMVRQFGHGIWKKRMLQPFITPIVGLMGRAALLDAREARERIVRE